MHFFAFFVFMRIHLRRLLQHYFPFIFCYVNENDPIQFIFVQPVLELLCSHYPQFLAEAY